VDMERMLFGNTMVMDGRSPDRSSSCRGGYGVYVNSWVRHRLTTCWEGFINGGEK